MLNSKINLNIDIDQYPKTKIKVAQVIKGYLLEFQKVLLGELGKGLGEEISLKEITEEQSKVDEKMIEEAMKSQLRLNPRFLYDIFGEIGIEISLKLEGGIWYYWNSKDLASGTASNRIEAEGKAFEQAFKTSEGIL